MAKKNLLIISIEDLNDWIEPLGGHPAAYTPNINYLCSISTSFNQAYATTPACSPSRTAALFSRAPWDTGIQTNPNKWYDLFNEDTEESLFGILSQNGYDCHGSGKIFHPAKNYPKRDFKTYSNPPKDSHPAISKAVKSGEWGKRSDFGIDESTHDSYDDRHIKELSKHIKKGSEGQVWAAGIFTPHLPFIAKRKYFDLINNTNLTPPGITGGVFDLKEKINLSQAGLEFVKQYSKNGKTLKKHDEYEKFIHSYLACISHADELVGNLLDLLKENELLDNTYICLWSDHGWQLGEKLCFRKFTLWERALRIPLMMSGPLIQKKTTNDLISLLDLAPTLLDLLDVQIPSSMQGLSHKSCLLGRSNKKVNNMIASTWCLSQKKQAVSLRYSNFRYIQYWSGDEELYLHPSDRYEMENVIEKNKEFDLKSARKIARDLIKKSESNFRSKKEVLNEHTLQKSVNSNKKPDFICIGIQKSGTTWLDSILEQSPYFWNPGIKELHYFDNVKYNGTFSGRLLKRLRQSKKKNLNQYSNIPDSDFSLDQYISLFDNAPINTVTYEITPSYFCMSQKQILHLINSLPEVKILCIIRDPLDRAISSFRMKLFRENPTDFNHAYNQWKETGFKRGNYLKYLPYWDKFVMPKNILYLPYGEIRNNPGELIHKIESFTGAKHYDKYDQIRKKVFETKKIKIPSDLMEDLKIALEPQYIYLKKRFNDEFLSAIK